jgi:hypothetical protein
MKIDFTKPLKNFKNEDLTDPRSGKVILVKDVLCTALAAVTNVESKDKLELSDLVFKIWNSSDETEITPEESVAIRKNINSLPSSIFAQVYRLLG